MRCRDVRVAIETEMAFGELLRRYRLAEDLTQEALAERAEMSERSIRALERGVNRPLRGTAQRLMAALGLMGEDADHFLEAAAPAPRQRVLAPCASRPVRRDALPRPATQMLGREREVAELTGLLGRKNPRLLTLTGPGGVGKTRLAVHVAREIERDFADGAVFVPLAPIGEPHKVLSAVARALDVWEPVSEPVEASLVSYLQEKELLLLLDNFEHVLEAGPRIAVLLAACPGLRALATSRAALRLQSEQVYPVPPLALSTGRSREQAGPPIPAALGEAAAIRLFVQRAQAVKPDFALTPDNAWAVREICAHLDGLPLAIELAAGRAALLSPQALLVRLAHPLRVLTGGAQDLPERQRTLRNTIAWSYELLDQEEKRIFERLGVFRGAFELSAVEAVCLENLPVDPLDGAGSLAAKNLLVAEVWDAEPRFRMLETIREYALERLEAAGGTEATHRRHAAHYLALAQECRVHQGGPEEGAWLRRMDRELDNIRAALRWSRDSGDLDTLLCLAAELFYFWYIRGYRREGRAWLEEGLALTPSNQHTAARAAALAAAGGLGNVLGDFARARAQMEEGTRIWRELGDKQSLCAMLPHLSIACAILGDGAAAAAAGEETLALAEETGDRVTLALTLHGMGVGAREGNDFEKARTLYDKSLTIFQELGSKTGLTLVTNSLGDLARLQGEYEAAAAHYEESLILAKDVGSKGQEAIGLHNLGHVACHLGDDLQARRCFEESLLLFREMADTRGAAECVAGLAGLAAEREPEWTARLIAAATAAVEAIGTELSSNNQVEYDRALIAARSRLDNGAFEAAWSEGRAMTLEQAAAEAHGDCPAS